MSNSYFRLNFYLQTPLSNCPSSDTNTTEVTRRPRNQSLHVRFRMCNADRFWSYEHYRHLHSSFHCLQPPQPRSGRTPPLECLHPCALIFRVPRKTVATEPLCERDVGVHMLIHLKEMMVKTYFLG